MEIAGEYCGKTFVPGFAERRWRSNGGWMEATGCATGAAICTCVLVQKRCGHPQVLPAYGLQDLRNERRSPKPKSNPNTMCLPGTLGEDHGSGHFYLAKTRTFLLCVDINGNPLSAQNENVRFVQSRNVRFHGWPRAPWRRR